MAYFLAILVGPFVLPLLAQGVYGLPPHAPPDAFVLLVAMCLTFSAFLALPFLAVRLLLWRFRLRGLPTDVVGGVLSGAAACVLTEAWVGSDTGFLIEGWQMFLAWSACAGLIWWAVNEIGRAVTFAAKGAA